MSDHLVDLLDGAFERAANDGPAALWTLLAVADAVAAPEHGEATHDGPGLVSDRQRRLRGVTGDAPTGPESGDRARPAATPGGPLVELGCGAGGRLAEAGEVRTVGIDRWPTLLQVARERTGSVVAADPARPPLRADTAGAVVSLGTLAAREPAADLLSTAAEVAGPAGVVTVAAPTEPRAVLRGGGSVDLDGYRVSWSVAAGRVREDRATVGIEYDVTRGGQTTGYVDHPTLRLYDHDTLATAASTAGLTDVRVERESGDWLVVSGHV